MEPPEISKADLLKQALIGKKSASYDRFVRVPAFLSSLMWAMFLINIPIAAFSLLPTTIFGVICAIPMIVAGYFLSNYVAWKVNRVLLRERLWQWGRTKFNTWEEMGRWVDRQSPERLDEVATLKDNEWEP